MQFIFMYAFRTTAFREFIITSVVANIVWKSNSWIGIKMYVLSHSRIKSLIRNNTTFPLRPTFQFFNELIADVFTLLRRRELLILVNSMTLNLELPLCCLLLYIICNYSIVTTVQYTIWIVYENNSHYPVLLPALKRAFL